MAPIAGANGGELLLAPSDHAMNRHETVAKTTSAQNETARVTGIPSTDPVSPSRRQPPDREPLDPGRRAVVDPVASVDQREQQLLADAAGEPHVERELPRRERVAGLDHPHEVLGVREVLDRLDVEVRPEVRAELEPRLGDGPTVTEVAIGRQPAVEPVALDGAAAGDDRGRGARGIVPRIEGLGSVLAPAVVHDFREPERAVRRQRRGLDERELESSLDRGGPPRERLAIESVLVEVRRRVPDHDAVGEQDARQVRGRLVVGGSLDVRRFGLEVGDVALLVDDGEGLAGHVAGRDRLALANDAHRMADVPGVRRRPPLVGHDVDRVGHVDPAPGPRIAGGREVEPAVAEVGVDEVPHREPVDRSGAVDEEPLEADRVGGRAVIVPVESHSREIAAKQQMSRLDPGERDVVPAERTPVAARVVKALSGVPADVDGIAAEVACRLHGRTRDRPG